MYHRIRSTRYPHNQAVAPSTDTPDQQPPYRELTPGVCEKASCPLSRNVDLQHRQAWRDMLGMS